MYLYIYIYTYSLVPQTCVALIGFLPVVKEGPKGLSGLKATDFQTIPIAIPICIFIYRADRPEFYFSLGEATARAPEVAQKR